MRIPSWTSPRRWRLQTSLAAALIVFAALLIVLTFVLERALLRERVQAELQHAVTVGQVAAAQLEGFLRDVESTTIAVAEALAHQSGPITQPANGPYLSRVAQSYGVLRGLFVTDLGGRVVASASGQGIGLDLSDRPYLRALRQGAERVWSDGLAGTETGRLTIAFGRTIRGPDRDRRGYLVVAFYPETLMARIVAPMPADARVTVIDQRAQIIYTTLRPEPAGAARDQSGRPNIQRALAGEVVALSGQPAPQTGDARYGALVPIPTTGWVLAFSRPLVPLRQQLQAPLRRQRALLGAAILLASAIGLLIILRLMRPLGHLAAAAAAITRGREPVLPAVEGPREVADLAAGMAVMSRAVGEREEMLRFLAEASKQLSGSLDYELVLRNLARLSVPRVADWCIIYLLDEAGTVQRFEVAHSDPDKQELARRLAMRPIEQGGAHPMLDVMRSGQARLLPEITDEILRAATGGDEEQYRMSKETGFRSAMLVPMTARGRPIGGIAFVAVAPDRRYTEMHLELAQEIANRAALAVDNARLYQREHSIAETLQRSLLRQRLPQIPGMRLASRYLPARRETEIGGDWYDAITLPDGRMAVVMGDVAGHGIAAAAVMGQLQNAVRAYAMEGHSPAAIFQRVTALLDLREMATLLYFVFDPHTWTAEYANAGHLPPLVLAPGEPPIVLETGSPPLGVAGVLSFREEKASIPPGSTILLYTDGLVEVRGEPLDDGLRRLYEAAAAHAGLEPEAMLDHLVASMLPGTPVSDDAALLALRVEPLDPARLHLRLDAMPPSVPLVRHTLRRWLEQSSAEASAVFAVAVAACEAFSNAIEHAYGAVDAQVEVEATWLDGSIELSVRDWGQWREPRGAGRGRGLDLIRALMDEVHVATGPAGTTVQMRHRMPRPAAV